MSKNKKNKLNQPNLVEIYVDWSPDSCSVVYGPENIEKDPHFYYRMKTKINPDDYKRLKMAYELYEWYEKYISELRKQNKVDFYVPSKFFADEPDMPKKKGKWMEAFLKTGKQIFNNKEIEVSELFYFLISRPDYFDRWHEIKINGKFAGIIVMNKNKEKQFIYSESQYQEYFTKEKNWARKIYKNPEDILYNLTDRK